MTASFRAAACIVGVAMLLSFPAITAHHFGPHFGATEIRRSIVRHTFVAGPEEDGLEETAHIDAQPAIPMPVIIENVAKGFFPQTIVSEVPAFRLLQHFKLRPSRSDAPDPLL